MPAPKIFAGAVNTLPRAWRDAIGNRPHNEDCELVIIANLKRDLTALLTDRGVAPSPAEQAAKEMRLTHQPIHWTHLRMAVDAGLVQPDQPGVYLWRRHSPSDSPIVRVEPDATLTVLGHFRFDPVQGGRGEYVEPAASGDSR